jgi:hypothetical protein
VSLGTSYECFDSKDARAYEVEIDELGPPARARRRDALTLFATYIGDRLERSEAPGPELPWAAYTRVVYAARQLASDALDAAPEPDLRALGSDLATWISELVPRIPLAADHMHGGRPGAGRSTSWPARPRSR